MTTALPFWLLMMEGKNEKVTNSPYIMDVIKILL